MEPLPKIVTRRLEVSPADPHPDANLLAAFAEDALTGGERERLLAHLAQCAECREVAALSMPEAVPLPATPLRRFPVLSWPVLRWGAAVACLVVVGAAVLLRHEYSAKQPVEVALQTTQEMRGSAAQPQTETRGESAPYKVAAPKQAEQKGRAKTADRAAQTDQFAAAPPAAGPAASKEQAANLPAATFSPARQARADVDNALGKAAAPLRDERAGSAAPAAASGSVQATSPDAAGKNAQDKDVATLPASAPAPPAAETASNKSKTGLNESMAQARRTGGIAALVSTMKQEGDASNYKKADLSPRWTLSQDGSLQRSLDAGKTWETLKSPAEGMTLRAIASFGTDVWVGGAAGVLYHSADGGEHWTQIKPMAGGKPLTGDILGIEFQNARQGRLTTSTQESWSTSDRGQTWERKQP
ncbi:MAG: zf-HC2 domain-containing protein [Acidobacteria bacterium]|nr:zf-HC2 domain-containing protein [Acidobacteriota bacterium]